MAKGYVKIADTKKISKEEWVELRRSGIGGSDAAAVVGLNPYNSAYSVYSSRSLPSLVLSFPSKGDTSPNFS